MWYITLVMATVVAPELKEALVSRGVWADFIRRREDIKAERGGTTRECSVAALEELAPDLADSMRLRGRPRKDFGASKSKATLADTKRAAKDERMGGEADAPTATRGMFAGKSCSNMQSLIWAVESLAFSDTKAEDAPSALAWSLYSLMVQSPSTKADIAKVTAAKIAQRVSAEEENGGGFDGEGEYSLLDAIAKEGGE